MRADFSPDVKRKLARRVADRCSNPGCRRPTSGPGLGSGTIVNLGVAAHITAASPGGPRYNATLTTQDRVSIDNGLWLCQDCAKLIDDDERRYSVEVLQNWKERAEEQARGDLVRSARMVLTSPASGSLPAGTLASLKDAHAYRDVFERVSPGQFIGREWLVSKVDHFIASNSNGYILLEAHAGLGKTAFAVWMAAARGYAHHFTVGAEDRRSSQVALGSLSAQLAACYQLDQFAEGGLMPGGMGSASSFQAILRQAAEAADGKGEKLVLVVDGLDEAEVRPGALPLGLPAALPDNAFIIATARTGTVVPVTGPREIVRIEATANANIADLQDYVARALDHQQTPAGSRLHAGQPVRPIAERIAAASAGVWIYAVLILEEISAGRRLADDLDSLPADLAAYYTLNMTRLRLDRRDWNEVTLPVLATLAAAAEPLDVTALAQFAGADQDARVDGLLHGPLWPFCHVTRRTGQPGWSLYHSSIREYLAGVEFPSGPSGEEGLRAEIRQAVRGAHQRISGRFLDAWGGITAGLPRLATEPTMAAMDARYGLRYLCYHLERAGCANDLHRLLSCELPGEQGASGSRNLWYFLHEQHGSVASYLADVARAQRIAAEMTDGELSEGRPAAGIGREVRYALMTASAIAQIHRIPLELMKALLTHKIWSSERVLTHIRQIADSEARAGGYALILELIPEQEIAAAADDAAVAAGSIRDAKARCQAFSALAASCPRPFRMAMLDKAVESAYVMLAEGLGETRHHQDDLSCTAILANLAGLVDEPGRTALLGGMMAAISGIEEEHVRAFHLAGTAHGLRGMSPGLVREAIAMIESMDGDPERAAAMEGLAPEVPQALLPEALDAARRIEEPYWRLHALASLFHAAPGPLRSSLWTELAQLLRELSGTYAIARSLARMAGPAARRRGDARAIDPIFEALRLDIDSRAPATSADRFLPGGHPDAADTDTVARAAMAAMFSLSDRDLDRDALEDLVLRLPPHLLISALRAIAKTAPDLHLVTGTLTSLAERMPSRHLAGMLATMQRLREFSRKPDPLLALIPRLPDRLLGAALAAARKISHPADRALPLCMIAHRSGADARPGLFREALACAAGTTAVQSIAPHLPAALVVQALEMEQCGRIGDERNIALFLATLARQSQGQDRRAFLDAALAMHGEPDHSLTLASISARLDEPEKSELLRVALDSIEAEIRQGDHDADHPSGRNLAVLVPQLKGSLARRAALLADEVEDSATKAEILAATAHAFSGRERSAMWRAALNAAIVAARHPRGLYGGPSAAMPIIGLIPVLPSSLLSEALAEVRKSGLPHAVFDALLAIAGRSRGRQREDAAQEALDLVLDKEVPRASIEVSLSELARVVPFLPKDVIADICRGAAQWPLSSTKRDRGFPKLLAQLARHLPYDQLAEASSLAARIGDPRERFDVLRALALREQREPRRSASYRELIECLRALPDDWQKCTLITEITPELPRTLIGDLLEITMQSECRFSKGQALAALIGAMDSASWTAQDSFPPAIRSLLPGLSRGDLIALLQGAIPHIAISGGGAALREAGSAIQDIQRWWP